MDIEVHIAITRIRVTIPLSASLSAAKARAEVIKLADVSQWTERSDSVTFVVTSQDEADQIGALFQDATATVREPRNRAETMVAVHCRENTLKDQLKARLETKFGQVAFLKELPPSQGDLARGFNRHLVLVAFSEEASAQRCLEAGKITCQHMDLTCRVFHTGPRPEDAPAPRAQLPFLWLCGLPLHVRDPDIRNFMRSISAVDYHIVRPSQRRGTAAVKVIFPDRQTLEANAIGNVVMLRRTLSWKEQLPCMSCSREDHLEAECPLLHGAPMQGLRSKPGPTSGYAAAVQARHPPIPAIPPQVLPMVIEGEANSVAQMVQLLVTPIQEAVQAMTTQILELNKTIKLLREDNKSLKKNMKSLKKKINGLEENHKAMVMELEDWNPASEMDDETEAEEEASEPGESQQEVAAACRASRRLAGMEPETA